MTTPLLVRATRLEAEGVLGVELEAPDGSDLPAWESGAHLDLHLPGGVRQYSLCGDMADRSLYRLAVLHEPTGRGGSAYVHTLLRPGHVVTVTGPRNRFPLDEARDYLFVAGGIGITAILPMVTEVARRGVPFRLLYGGRSARSMAFTHTLRPYADKVTISPQDTHGLLDLETALGLPRPGLAVYACGPEPLLKALEERTSPDHGWAPGTLHVERFAVPPPAETVGNLSNDAGFEVVLARTGTTVQVGPDTSVLDAVVAAGADVISDCREGICATCETKVLEGTVDHRDYVLTDAERASCSAMMVCVSRASCSRLVLDL